MQGGSGTVLTPRGKAIDCALSLEDSCRRLFYSFDFDNSGTIDKDELLRMIKVVQKRANVQWESTMERDEYNDRLLNAVSEILGGFERTITFQRFVMVYNSLLRENMVPKDVGSMPTYFQNADEHTEVAAAVRQLAGTFTDAEYSFLENVVEGEQSMAMAIVGEKLHLDRKRLIVLLKMWNQTKSKMHLTGVRKKLQEMMKKFADERTKLAESVPQDDIPRRRYVMKEAGHQYCSKLGRAAPCSRRP